MINAAPLAYIFPALCVLKLQNERILSWKNLPMILMALFGLLVTVSGFILVMIEIAHGVSCSHGAEMPYCLSESSPYQNETVSGVIVNYTRLANEIAANTQDLTTPTL